MTRRITPKDGADADQERTEKKVTNPVTAKSPADGKERLAAAKRRVARATTKAPKAQVGQSKAARARALFAKGMTVNQVAAALPDVSVSYAWDIAAAMERATGQTIIASHAPKAPAATKAKATTRKRTTKGMSKEANDQLAMRVVAPEAVAS